MYWIVHFTALCSLMRVTRSIFAFAQIRQRSKCLFGKNYANFYLVLNGSFMVHFGNSRRVCDLSNCPQRLVTTTDRNIQRCVPKKNSKIYWHWAGWCFSFEGMVCIPWTIFLFVRLGTSTNKSIFSLQKQKIML